MEIGGKIFPPKKQDIVPRSRRACWSHYGDVYGAQSTRREKAVLMELGHKQRFESRGVLGLVRRLE